jgi:hypothetical protein
MQKEKEWTGWDLSPKFSFNCCPLWTRGRGLGRELYEKRLAEVVGSNPTSFIFVDLVYYGIELRLF